MEAQFIAPDAGKIRVREIGASQIHNTGLVAEEIESREVAVREDGSGAFCPVREPLEMLVDGAGEPRLRDARFVVPRNNRAGNAWPCTKEACYRKNGTSGKALHEMIQRLV